MTAREWLVAQPWWSTATAAARAGLSVAVHVPPAAFPLDLVALDRKADPFLLVVHKGCGWVNVHPCAEAGAAWFLTVCAREESADMRTPLSGWNHGAVPEA